MNILIPDNWLREFLKTPATPKQLKDCLSLCGPSIERINQVGKEIVYDIEVTSNRPDMMSVAGIAREASVILPKFDIKAEFINNPYQIKKLLLKSKITCALSISTDELLNPRFTAIVIDNIHNKPSPPWMQKQLELSGMRPINTVVDVTNYLMKAFGQPMHAFDYDQILPDKNGVPTMILRASRKGEKIMTLDGKMHTLPGDDIVIEDGSGRLIDLCGIMGGGVSHIKDTSTRIVLFVQTYDPSHIRRTSMALSHRTEAAGLFEKGIDEELVMPTIVKGIELITKYTGGITASKLYDIYPKPYKPYTVSVTRTKINTYIGEILPDKEITQTLTSLGFTSIINDKEITVTVPSFRRDITIDVDVIEEIARIHGYHTIKTKLPDTEPPMVLEDPFLIEELSIKQLLKDWGYGETLTCSMISEKLMDIYELDKNRAYKITNPLSQEWVYMRPTLLPSMLDTIKYNLSYEKNLQLFELSMIYQWKPNDIPIETPMLIVASTGQRFYEMKGISEKLFEKFGITYPANDNANNPYFHKERSLELSKYGIIGEINPKLLQDIGISERITVLLLDIQKLFIDRHMTKTYMPLPKFPASFEDIALVIPEYTYIGPVITEIKKIDPLIIDVSLLDSYENTRTLHVTYQAKDKNLTSEDITPVRKKILHIAEKKFGATLKI